MEGWQDGMALLGFRKKARTATAALGEKHSGAEVWFDDQLTR